MWQDEPGPAVGDKDRDAHSSAHHRLLPGPEKRCHWDLQNSILSNSQETLEGIRQAGRDLKGPSPGTSLLVSERRWDGRCAGRDPWVTRTGSRTRGSSAVKAPLTMVLSEGSFLGALSRSRVMVHPISSSERRCPYKELRVSAPEASPNWQTPLQTQTDQ